MRKKKVKQPRSILSVCLRADLKQMAQMAAKRHRLTTSQWAARLIEDALTPLPERSNG